MNEKAALLLEVEKNDRKYTFTLPIGAPYGECYDAAHDVLKKIIEMQKAAADASERKKEEVEIKTDDDKKGRIVKKISDL